MRIEAPVCTEGPFARTAWVALARSEIETDGVRVLDEGARDDAVAVIRVEVTPCRADATEAALTIDDLLTRKTVRRVVALDDVPTEGRARALALAAAELLRASWAELALADAPVRIDDAPPVVRRAVLLRLAPSVRTTPPTTPATTPAPAPPARPWWAGATLDVRAFPGQSGALLGGRAVAMWSPWRGVPMRLRADVGASYGSALARRGEVSLVLATVALGALVGGGNDRVDLGIGPRVEFGWAWVEGRPTDTRLPTTAGDDAVLFATLAATLRVTLTPRFVAVVDVAAGQTLSYLTVSADGEQVTGLRGPVLSVGLGLGATW